MHSNYTACRIKPNPSRKGLQNPLNVDLAQLSASCSLSPAQVPSHLLFETFSTVPSTPSITKILCPSLWTPIRQCIYTSDTILCTGHCLPPPMHPEPSPRSPLLRELSSLQLYAPPSWDSGMWSHSQHQAQILTSLCPSRLSHFLCLWWIWEQHITWFWELRHEGTSAGESVKKVSSL